MYTRQIQRLQIYVTNKLEYGLIELSVTQCMYFSCIETVIFSPCQVSSSKLVLLTDPQMNPRYENMRVGENEYKYTDSLTYTLTLISMSGMLHE